MNLTHVLLILLIVEILSLLIMLKIDPEEHRALKILIIPVTCVIAMIGIAFGVYKAQPTATTYSGAVKELRTNVVTIGGTDVKLPQLYANIRIGDEITITKERKEFAGVYVDNFVVSE